MKVGVIARCDDRGLGNQTLEACRHLNPERVLLIDPGHDKRFQQHPERFNRWDTTRVRWNGRLDPDPVTRWLDGLDVVYTAETPYDERLPRWAAKAGVGVAVHANPEFLTRVDMKMPVTWWVATPWRIEHLPSRTRVVPMPVAEPRVRHEPGDRVRFLHVAGWPTVADRNGTEIVTEAAGLVTVDCDVTVRGQHDSIRSLHTRRSSARLVLEAGNVADYWDLYRYADVLVMPRRFGGLCLPVQEAMTVGLPVVMSDCSPNEVWPGPRVPTSCTREVRTRCGNLPLHDADPRALAETMDELAANGELIDKLRHEAAEWVAGNTWDALKPMWLDELERACW